MIYTRPVESFPGTSAKAFGERVLPQGSQAVKNDIVLGPTVAISLPVEGDRREVMCKQAEPRNGDRD